MKPIDLLRNLPSVNELLENPRLKSLVDRASRHTVVSRVRGVLDDVRREVQSAAGQRRLPDIGELADRIVRRMAGEQPGALQPLINATGVLLPRGLGGAPLADEAIAAMVAAAGDFTRMDLAPSSSDTFAGQTAAAALLCESTGAESAVVVNSGAMAFWLTLAALCAGRECVVSRGHLVELSDGAKLPDLIASSGATAREVGTANRTETRDYAAALCDRTGAMLVVSGDMAPGDDVAGIAELGRSRHIPVVCDLDFGGLNDAASLGGGAGPSAREMLAQRCEVVLLRGDGLLGGPAAGIIVGSSAAVERVAAHPLARAARADKLTLAALAATLALHREVDLARYRVPLLQLLSAPIENLKLRAESMAQQLAAIDGLESAEAVERRAALRDGAPAHRHLPTWCVAVRARALDPGELFRSLQAGEPAVVGRVEEDRLLLDLRGVFPRQDMELIAAVSRVVSAES